MIGIPLFQHFFLFFHCFCPGSLCPSLFVLCQTAVFHLRATLHSPRLPLYFPASLLLHPTSALFTLPLKCILSLLLPAIAFIKHQARLWVPHRSGPRCGDGTCVAPPSLRGLSVLLVGPFEHLFHVADLILAHGRHINVAPEMQHECR